NQRSMLSSANGGTPENDCHSNSHRGDAGGQEVGNHRHCRLMAKGKWQTRPACSHDPDTSGGGISLEDFEEAVLHAEDPSIDSVDRGGCLQRVHTSTCCNLRLRVRFAHCPSPD